MPKLSIKSTVHQLLEAHQEYSPVELLKAEKLLSEERYRAWRTGGISSLDEAVDDVRLAREILKSALAFAKGLELVSERVAYHGLGDCAGRELVASTDPLLNELLVHRHRPADSGQGDLFLDGGKTASINALLGALIARDAGRARKELQRTAALVPGYRHLQNGETLIDALQAPLPGVRGASFRVARTHAAAMAARGPRISGARAGCEIPGTGVVRTRAGPGIRTVRSRTPRAARQLRIRAGPQVAAACSVRC